MSSTDASTSSTVVIGRWTSFDTRSNAEHSAYQEAQIITGTHVSLPPAPPRATTSAPRVSEDATDPIDDFFGVTRNHRGTQNSRHDEPARPIYFAEDTNQAEMAAPPPPYADASDLPSYAAVAEPPTLAMYFFKFGFVFPLFWLAGIIILFSPLSAPENWEPTKTEAERQELIDLLRKTERKWAKRCLWAFLIIAVIATIITAIAIPVMRS